jgi:hypothetical protein
VRRSTRPALWLILMVAALCVQTFAPTPQHSLLWTALEDAAHVPLFGVVGFLVLRASSASTRWRGGSRARQYVLALVVTAGIGALTELIQAFVGRDADVLDLARDVLGGAAALLVALCFDSKLRLALGSKQRLRAPLLLVAVTLLSLALRPAATVVHSYLARNAAFPRLCDFGSAWGQTFIVARDAAIQVTDPPSGWAQRPRARVACVTFSSTGTPAFVLREPYPDWTGYDTLVFEVFSASPETMEIVLRIDDVHHNNAFSDRFNRALAIHPAANRIAIRLREIEEAPRGRAMDLTRIRTVTLFVAEPSRSFALYLDAVRLERD